MAKKSFKIRGNLAEALDDTVSSAKNHAGELHIEIIPLRKIRLDSDNPRDLLLSFEDLYGEYSGTSDEIKRKKEEKSALSSMSKSIKEQGIINPVVVYKHGDQYRLIAGERRTLASIIAEKIDIPAKILTAKPDQLKLSLIQWIENIEREDLSLWERLRNLEKIVGAYTVKESKTLSDFTATNLAQLLGCSIQQATNYKSILNAPDELKNHIQLNEISNIEKAALISKSPKSIQNELIQACLAGNTLSEMKKMVKQKPLQAQKSLAGRPSAKVNFGFTSNLNVAKTILDSVANNKNLDEYTAQLPEVNWDSPKSITAAFKHLIKLLEHA
jgi:ParB family transcriptional regulator, chromosome partitioning protein